MCWARAGCTISADPPCAEPAIPHTNGKPGRIFQAIGMRIAMVLERNHDVRCEENRTRNFCRQHPVIGVTVKHRGSGSRSNVKPYGEDVMDKRWLIAAAFLSAASLVACDNSGSKSSGSSSPANGGSSATKSSPSSSGSSSATSPSHSSGSSTSPSSGSSSSATSPSAGGASSSGASSPSSTPGAGGASSSGSSSPSSMPSGGGASSSGSGSSK